MRVMNYSVKPEIKHKPKEVEEKFTVWEAGGRILATTTKDDAELIVRALNRDEVFDDMAEFFAWYCGPERGCSAQGSHKIMFPDEPMIEPCGDCPPCRAISILAKIDALKGGG